MSRRVLALAVLALAGAPGEGLAAPPGSDQAVVGVAYLAQDAPVMGGRVTLRNARGRLVGRGRTTALGGFRIRDPRLRSRSVRKRLVVTVAGGRARGKPHRGRLQAAVDNYRDQYGIAVSPVTTIAVELLASGRARTVRRAEAKAQRALNIPAHYDHYLHTAHSSRFLEHGHFRRHVRAHGGQRSWVQYMARLAHRGSAARGLGGGPRATTSQATAFTIALLNQGLASCSGSNVPGVGYAVSALRSLDVAGENPVCESLRTLKAIQDMLANMSQTLTGLQHTMDDLYDKVVGGTYDLASTPLKVQVADVQLALRQLQIQAASQPSLGDLQEVMKTYLKPLVNYPARFRALLSTDESQSSSVLLDAFTKVRSNRRFWISSQQDAYNAMQDYWYEQAGHAAALVAEYYNGFNQIRTQPPTNANALSDGYIKATIKDAAARADWRPVAMTPLADHVMLDPNPVYTDMISDGVQITPASGAVPELRQYQNHGVSNVALLWSYYCNGSTSSSSCTVASWQTWATQETENDNVDQPICQKATFPLTLSDGRPWNVAMLEQWKTMTDAKDTGDTVATWLAWHASGWFPTGTWAFYLTRSESTKACPSGRDDTNYPHGIKIVNLAATTSSDNFVAGPLQAGDTAISMLVRPVADGERFILTPADFAAPPVPAP